MKSQTSLLFGAAITCLTAATSLAQVRTLPISSQRQGSGQPIFPISAGSEPVGQQGDMAKTAAFSPASGLQVQSLPQGGMIVVESAGLAAQAGLRVGDIIWRVNGRLASRLAELESTLEANGSVVLAVQDGTNRQLKNIVLIGPNPRLPDELPASSGPADGDLTDGAPTDLEDAGQPTLPDPAVSVPAQRYRLPNLGAQVEHTPGRGMLVSTVHAGSKADQMNLLPGDVIVRINRTWTIDQAFDARSSGAIEVQLDRHGNPLQLRYEPRNRSRHMCPPGDGHLEYDLRWSPAFDLSDIFDLIGN